MFAIVRLTNAYSIRSLTLHVNVFKRNKDMFKTCSAANREGKPDFNITPDKKSKFTKAIQTQFAKSSHGIASPHIDKTCIYRRPGLSLLIESRTKNS